MSIKRIILLLLVLPFALSCERQKCDVPSMPVQFEINTMQYPYATYLAPGCVGQTLAITAISNNTLQLQFSNETTTKPRFDGEYIGYAGLLVWIDMNGDYQACDLCCPNCLDPKVPVEVDGLFAICPVCGERFDLSHGTAFPQEGVTKQALRHFAIRYFNHRITINN